MPQIGWLEILTVVIIAILVLGPKEFPIALKKIGSFFGKLKNTISSFQREVTSVTDDIDIEKNITNSDQINNNLILPSQKYLKNKKISEITLIQKRASENVFKKKNIHFRSFEIKKRNEKTLGELFTFFILETILLGKCLGLDPYDQPAVELIKKETKKLLI